MKRHRDGVESMDLANCLMLLSRGKLLSAPPNLHSRMIIPECKHGGAESENGGAESKPQNILGSEEYKCMTCNRKFSSFQALGGHRAGHKKPKLDLKEHRTKKPKKHECSFCGRVFSLDQALGGHMKTHRIGVDYGLPSMNRVLVKVPVHKKPNSKRVLFLDLNLTPLQNDLKLFGDKAPKVDSFV